MSKKNEKTDVKKPSPQDLADGSILMELKMQFIKNSDSDSLLQLLCCLHDSTVFVPMNLIMSKSDERALTQNPFAAIPDNKVKYSPELIESEEGENALPMFSNKSQVPKDFLENLALIPVRVLDCINYVRQSEKIDHLALDPFTDSIKIPMELAQVIESFKI
ncbi:MAG: SseB family protein [Treponemataceae bacterium]|nr:SseB family protein [Treponemataceae bacterium]